jgi:hypothetical protein
MKICRTLFHRIISGLTLLVVFAGFTAPAHAAQLARVDVTYFSGDIVSGQLSADLDALPASVHATFLLNGEHAGSYGLGDVLAASLPFGDGAWHLGDLESFAATLLATDNGALDVTSLTYAFGVITTPASSAKLAGNFPLEIEGTDLDNNPYHYLYDESLQTVTLVPEPASGIALLVAMTVWFFRCELVASSPRWKNCRRPKLATWFSMWRFENE